MNVVCCARLQKMKEKLCSLNSVISPSSSPTTHSALSSFHTTTATNMTFIQSLTEQKYNTCWHTWTTLICLAHKSRWVMMQSSYMPSAYPVRTRDLWRKSPTPSQPCSCYLGELQQWEWECERRAEIISWNTNSRHTSIPGSLLANCFLAKILLSFTQQPLPK